MALVDTIVQAWKKAGIKEDIPAPQTDERGFVEELSSGTYQGTVTNPDNISIADYREMLDTDGTIRSMMNLISLPIQSARLTIVPKDNDNGEADFIRTVFEGSQYEGGMSTPFQLVLADISRASLDGFRFYQKVFYIIQRGEYAGKIGVKKLAPRDAESIELKTDEHGGFAGAVQDIITDGKDSIESFDVEESLLYTNKKEFSWLYGESDFKTAYRHWSDKQRLLSLLHHQMYTGALKFKILENEQGGATDSTEVKRNMRRLDQVGGKMTALNVPTGFKFRMEDAAGSLPILDAIQHHNAEIAKSVLAQFINLGEKDTGSFALSKEQGDWFTQSIKARLENIAWTLNSYLIAPLIAINFGSDAVPEVKLTMDKNIEGVVIDILNTIAGKALLPQDAIDSLVGKAADMLGLDLQEKAPTEVIEPVGNGQDKQVQDLTNTLERTITERDEAVGLAEEALGLQAAKRYRRARTRAERATSLEAIDRRFGVAERNITKALRPILEGQRERILKVVRDVAATEDITKLKNLPEGATAAFNKELRQELNTVLDFGKTIAAKDLDKPVPTTPKERREALAIRSEATTVQEITKMNNEVRWGTLATVGLEGEVFDITTPAGKRAIVANAVGKLDSFIESTLAKLAGFFSVYAMNQGRDITYDKYRADIEVLQYSAILDEVTCTTCESLDARVVAASDPDYDNFQPPIHGNCRCLWIAIPAGDPSIPELDPIPSSIAPSTVGTFKEIKNPV